MKAFEAGISDGHEPEFTVTRKHKEVGFLLFGVDDAERTPCWNGRDTRLEIAAAFRCARGSATNGKAPPRMHGAKGNMGMLGNAGRAANAETPSAERGIGGFAGEATCEWQRATAACADTGADNRES